MAGAQEKLNLATFVSTLRTLVQHERKASTETLLTTTCEPSSDLPILLPSSGSHRGHGSSFPCWHFG